MRNRREDGIALIAVLWMLMLLSIVGVALSFETRASMSIARNGMENAAARAAADAGIQRAILDLVSSPELQGTRKFRADGTIYIWRFDNNEVHLSMKNEGAKINLNQAPEALLSALLRSVGVEQERARSLAGAIADFRDADNSPRFGGAEEAAYRDAGVAWGPKNAPFEALEELQQILGMTPEIYARIEPGLTIYSTALLSGAPDERLRKILREAGFNSPSFGGSTGPVFSIRAEAKSSHGAVFVREAVVQLDPGRPMPWILWWRQGVPASAPST